MRKWNNLNAHKRSIYFTLIERSNALIEHSNRSTAETKLDVIMVRYKNKKKELWERSSGRNSR